MSAPKFFFSGEGGEWRERGLRIKIMKAVWKITLAKNVPYFALPYTTILFLFHIPLVILYVLLRIYTSEVRLSLSTSWNFDSKTIDNVIALICNVRLASMPTSKMIHLFWKRLCFILQPWVGFCTDRWCKTRRKRICHRRYVLTTVPIRMWMHYCACFIVCSGITKLVWQMTRSKETPFVPAFVACFLLFCKSLQFLLCWVPHYYGSFMALHVLLLQEPLGDWHRGSVLVG